MDVGGEESGGIEGDSYVSFLSNWQRNGSIYYNKQAVEDKEGSGGRMA